MNFLSIALFIAVIVIYFLCGTAWQNISMFVGIIYASLMCRAQMLSEKWVGILVYFLLGTVCLFLLYSIKEPEVKKKGRKSRIAAALLSLFLGGVGIHKFYLSRKISGAFYILLLWTTVPIFLSVIEAIYLFAISDEKFDEKYNCGASAKEGADENRPTKTKVQWVQADDNLTANSDNKDTAADMPDNRDYPDFELPNGGKCHAKKRGENSEIKITYDGHTFIFGAVGDEIVSHRSSETAMAERY